MARNFWQAVLACLAGLALTNSIQAGEKLDWFKSLKPAVFVPAQNGKRSLAAVGDFKPAGATATPAGRAQLFEAAVLNSPGVSVRAAELDDYPAIVVFLKFERGLEHAQAGGAYAVGTGLELDKPAKFKRVLAFGMTSFAPPQNKIVPSAGPVLFYNDKFDTVMVSPLDHFLVSMMGGSGGRLQVGLEGDLKTIPAGFEHPVVFYFGKGIRSSFDDWGALLRKWHGKERSSPDADVGIAYLGYWTDNGAYYYYKTEGDLTYAQTLLAVKADADKLGVPFKYFQLDSWWYPKTTDTKGGKGIGPLDFIKHFISGGAYKWEARPELFPGGLEKFRNELGLPLIAHARWFDRQNEYRGEYQFVDGEGGRNPAFPVEDRFWDMIMSNAKKWGIAVYEQDWLDVQWRTIPYLRESVEAGDKWLLAMSSAAQKQGLTIQYCMANPGMFMQAVKYPNITQVRTSNDYMAGMPKQIHWIPFTKTNMLAWAAGLYPWKDTHQSSSGERVARNERRAEEETLMAVLSAGMVGPGDKIGFINKDLLLRTCRADGLLLKPDRPAMPIDKMFAPNATLYTTITETRTGAGIYYFVAGYNIYPERYWERELSFQELGVAPGDYLVYCWKGRKILPAKGKIVFPPALPIYRSAYYVLVPDNRSGLSLIGEWDKFVPVSNARFKKIEAQGNKISLQLAGVPGEEISLAFRADKKPEAKIVSGAKETGSNYDGASRIFSLQVKMSAEKAGLEVSI